MGREKSDYDIEKPGKHKKRKRRRSPSSSDSSPESIDEELKQKLLKKLKKLKKKERKKRKKKKVKDREEDNKKNEKKCIKDITVEENEICLENSKKFAPMTKEEWEKQQNTLRRVYDEETGRTRLVRGNGEIVEECVSRERQLAINKQATLKDGEYFQKLQIDSIMNTIDVVENFFGVYLLKSLNPKYKGRTYIGYTVDPNRRIKQHNRGKEFGGAWRTSKRGPWEMVLTVYGFPSDVSALRFEWAWQHPKRSRRLKSIITNKKSSETSLQYNIKIMFTMLSTPPWNRLPLTIRWLSADVVIDAPPNLTPPAHIPVTYGSVVSKKVKQTKSSQNMDEIMKPEMDGSVGCQICLTAVNEKDLLNCVNGNCKGSWHIFCLADKFLTEEIRFSSNAIGEPAEKGRKRIIPVEGSCPKCKSFILWGDLIRKKQGCFGDVGNFNNSFSSDS